MVITVAHCGACNERHVAPSQDAADEWLATHPCPISEAAAALEENSP